MHYYLQIMFSHFGQHCFSLFHIWIGIFYATGVGQQVTHISMKKWVRKNESVTKDPEFY